jgi:hypothetical protein
VGVVGSETERRGGAAPEHGGPGRVPWLAERTFEDEHDVTTQVDGLAVATATLTLMSPLVTEATYTAAPVGSSVAGVLVCEALASVQAGPLATARQRGGSPAASSHSRRRSPAPELPAHQ